MWVQRGKGAKRRMDYDLFPKSFEGELYTLVERHNLTCTQGPALWPYTSHVVVLYLLGRVIHPPLDQVS